MRTPNQLRVAIIFIAATLAVAVAGSSTSAAILDEAPLEVLVAEADRVVHGHVVAAEPEWAADGRRHIVTRVRVVVWETLHGAWLPSLTTVELLLPGGRRDGFVTWVPGVPTLLEGDEVVLLLEEVAPGHHLPLGYSLGVFFVEGGELPWPLSALVPGEVVP